MPRELLTNQKWLPGELLSECLKARLFSLDMKYWTCYISIAACMLYSHKIVNECSIPHTRALTSCVV